MWSANVSRLPSTTWRMLAERPKDRELPRGLDAIWDAAFGVASHLKPRRGAFVRRAERIVASEDELRNWAAAKLKEETQRLRDIFRCGRDTPADLDRAFAVIAETANRHIGMRPFAVQVAGALAIEAGCVVEMATGEGKTLTATLPATVAGWRGKGCHVITVNDYLAQRDAEWMAQIYSACGLTVAAVTQGMPPPERRGAYHADITYTTNKEVTADFLRDRLSLGRLAGLPAALLAHMADGAGSGADRMVQRGLAHAIIDEADSIMIDEAVTPLIISGEAPNAEQVEAFREAASMAGQLDAGRDYRVSRRFREVDLTEAGKRRLSALVAGRGGLWTGARRSEELVVQALTAREFYLRDKQYVIDPESQKVVIVDEFTGRLMPDREWRDGLHQAVEAKELVKVNPPKDTFARISFQRFFRLYRKLSGMTGTAAEGWREFWQIYHMPVVSIPTNRPCVRRHLPDRVFATEEAKWAAIVEEIRSVRRHGRPVLVGTRSVRASEHLSQLLMAEGIENQILNAVRHAEEAQIVAAAGQGSRVTVATNMAGRGTDIKLGDNITQTGGLFVLGTERHEAGRIDRQLYGRCGRQGDPGSCRAIVSLEDELVTRYAPHLAGSLRRRYGKTDRELTSPLVRRLFDLAQHRAERMALSQRKSVLQSDNWLDQNLGFAGSET
jgi:preprotein translocase subunit SecA